MNEKLLPKYPTGVCAYCGEYIYNEDTYCSQVCKIMAKEELGDNQCAKQQENY